MAEQPKLEIFYSEYGYVQINKNDLTNESPLIYCEGKYGKFTGKILKTKLKDKINIKLKTFYGSRKMNLLEIDINDKISKVVNLLISEESKDPELKEKFIYNSQYRLLTMCGKIKDLSCNKTPFELNLKNEQIVLLFEPLKVQWSEFCKGPGIFLESQNKIATKNGEEFQMVLFDKGFNFGKHYFEITLETVPDEMSIVLGATLKRSDYYINMSDFRSFWGYVCSINNASKKVSYTNKVEHVQYGEVCKMGDKVGILLDFNEGGLDISFFVNKIGMGIAFKKLPFDTYYPCCVLYFDGSRVKLEKNVPFPDI